MNLSPPPPPKKWRGLEYQGTAAKEFYNYPKAPSHTSCSYRTSLFVLPITVLRSSSTTTCIPTARSNLLCTRCWMSRRTSLLTSWWSTRWKPSLSWSRLWTSQGSRVKMYRSSIPKIKSGQLSIFTWDCDFSRQKLVWPMRTYWAKYNYGYLSGVYWIRSPTFKYQPQIIQRMQLALNDINLEVKCQTMQWLTRKEKNIRLPILTSIFFSGHQYWHPVSFPVTNIGIQFLFRSPVFTAIFFSGHLVFTAIFFSGHQYWQGGFCQEF